MTPKSTGFCLLLAALILVSFTSGQAQATEQDAGIWAIFSSTDTLQSDGEATRWRYWFDAQARFFDLGSGNNQYLLRPGIGYDLNDNLTVWAGYARFRTRSSSGNYSDEDRFWQQLTWTAARWQHGTLGMRLRFEERSVSNGDDLGLVLRYMVKYTHPLGDTGKRDLLLSLEPFVALRDTDWAGDSGVRQNRLAVGIAWKLSDKTSLETSYMNVYGRVDDGQDRMRHLGVINLKKKF